MKKLLVLSCAAGAAVVISSAALLAAFKVEANKENVVASRIEGQWQRSADLTERLTGQQQPKQGGLMSFKNDPSVAGKIPAKYEEIEVMRSRKVYMAGTMSYRGRDYPFILVEMNGNPHIVYFRDKEGEPMGDAESFNVMLAPAKDPADDLLFIGGDFNNQPFTAYERMKQ
ncbi:MAG TPA: hypothetical protein VM141_02090 [Planctomycetota bacterium]|nr:hypothetical protein [Planctomycetota bacterium]